MFIKKLCFKTHVYNNMGCQALISQSLTSRKMLLLVVESPTGLVLPLYKKRPLSLLSTLRYMNIHPYSIHTEQSSHKFTTQSIHPNLRNKPPKLGGTIHSYCFIQQCTTCFQTSIESPKHPTCHANLQGYNPICLTHAIKF